MQGFNLVPATGPYVQQGVRVHCIILHRSAYSRGVQARRERKGSSQVSAKVVGTPGLGYPLLLYLDKSLVVILNYDLTAEQPDPYGPEPYSPVKRPRTRSPLGRVR